MYTFLSVYEFATYLHYLFPSTWHLKLQPSPTVCAALQSGSSTYLPSLNPLNLASISQPSELSAGFPPRLHHGTTKPHRLRQEHLSGSFDKQSVAVKRSMGKSVSSKIPRDIHGPPLTDNTQRAMAIHGSLYTLQPLQTSISGARYSNHCFCGIPGLRGSFYEG